MPSRRPRTRPRPIWTRSCRAPRSSSRERPPTRPPPRPRRTTARDGWFVGACRAVGRRRQRRTAGGGPAEGVRRAGGAADARVVARRAARGGHPRHRRRPAGRRIPTGRLPRRARRRDALCLGPRRAGRGAGGRGARPRRGAPARHAGRVLPRAGRAGGRRVRDRRGARARHDQGGRRGPRRDRHARPLAPVGGADAAGLPARGAHPRAGRAGRRARPRNGRCVADRARRWDSSRRGDDPGELQGDHAARPARGRAAAARAMLTDYHVHLRPDADDTPAARYLTAANADRYRTAAEEHGIAELGVAEHVHRFTAALDVWQHPFWRSTARDDLDRYVAFVREDTDLRLGIEADFVPGREDRMAALLDTYEWDYVIGSVHFLGDYAVDWDDEAVDIWRRESTPERVWKRYFDTLREATLSGLYDVMAHPDLVKVWGSGRPLPDTDLRRYYEPAVEAMLDAGVAMEVSTAGLRKPVREIYPARAMLEMAVDAGLPIALSSDAHLPAQIDFEYDAAVALLRDCGVEEICTFSRRERRLEPLG